MIKILQLDQSRIEELGIYECYYVKKVWETPSQEAYQNSDPLDYADLSEGHVYFIDTDSNIEALKLDEDLSGWYFIYMGNEKFGIISYDNTDYETLDTKIKEVLDLNIPIEDAITFLEL